MTPRVHSEDDDDVEAHDGGIMGAEAVWPKVKAEHRHSLDDEGMSMDHMIEMEAEHLQEEQQWTIEREQW